MGTTIPTSHSFWRWRSSPSTSWLKGFCFAFPTMMARTQKLKEHMWGFCLLPGMSTPNRHLEIRESPLSESTLWVSRPTARRAQPSTMCSLWLSSMSPYAISLGGWGQRQMGISWPSHTYHSWLLSSLSCLFYSASFFVDINKWYKILSLCAPSHSSSHISPLKHPYYQSSKQTMTPFIIQSPLLWHVAKMVDTSPAQLIPVFITPQKMWASRFHQYVVTQINPFGKRLGKNTTIICSCHSAAASFMVTCVLQSMSLQSKSNIKSRNRTKRSNCLSWSLICIHGSVFRAVQRKHVEPFLLSITAASPRPLWAVGFIEIKTKVASSQVIVPTVLRTQP
jgi:hypothetical protein